MAKKQSYELNMKNGERKFVEGEVYGNFGIHKREDKMYTLTHIPSGCLVVSDSKKKELVKLLKDEEFSQVWWESPMPDFANITQLKIIISKFYSKKC